MAKETRAKKKPRASGKTKKDSSQNGRYKVNFTNAKVKNVISRMEICEGRLSKEAFLKASNKDIYYQMLHSGYIKQKGGTIVATSKLRAHVADTNGTHFSSSCSIEHSANVENVLSLLPTSVLDRRAYTTQSDLEIRYKRDFRNNPSYGARLGEMKSRYEEALDSLKKEHLAFKPSSGTEKMQEALHYKNELHTLESRLAILENEPCLIPDFQVRLTSDELSLFMENLISHRDRLTEEEEIERYTQAVEALRSLQSEQGEGEVTLCIEVVTTHYMQREIFKHQNYAQITGQPLIMI